MSRLLALIVLCGLCISAFAAKNCIFDIETFTTDPDSDDIVVDTSGQRIATLIEGGQKYNYITGPVRFKSAIDDSFSVDFYIQQLPDGQAVRGNQDACYFSQNPYRQFFLPFAAKHSDLPNPFNICNVEAGTTFNFLQANNSKELIAPSQLKEGRFYFEVTFLNRYTNAGSIRGNFNVIRT